MSQTGRISEWKRERGFGYLDCEGRRVFLHFRDFKERHKQPEVGDVINFVMGADQQGRSCAKEAIHANDGGRLRVWHFLVLTGLLVLPGVAVYRGYGRTTATWVAGWSAIVSWFTYMIYAWDKHRARDKGQREPEKMLHLLEVLGGWPGAFLAQRKLRHKSSKRPYQFVFVLIIGLHQFLALDVLRGWPFIHLGAQLVRKLF